MSDIFISYKREEQPEARKLADALEREGWTVWWDPKLRAGEHFDDVIEMPPDPLHLALHVVAHRRSDLDVVSVDDQVHAALLS